MASNVEKYDSGLKIVGLKELQQELRKAGPEMAKRLQQVNKRLVTEIVDLAKQRMYTSVASVDPAHVPIPKARVPGTGSLSRTKASIRPQAEQKRAKVLAGGPKAPAFFGHEFGGGAKPTTHQFPIHRGRDGYFLYPTVREQVREAEDRWNRIFDEVFP